MKTAPMALLSAALCAFALCAVAMAPAAGAAVTYYNCVNKPPFAWCDGKANGSFDGLGSWDYNEAWNPGSGTFPVCERVYRPATGGVLNGWGCAHNWIAHYYGDVQCNCYEAHARHEAGGNRNVNGYADSAF